MRRSPDLERRAHYLADEKQENLRVSNLIHSLRFLLQLLLRLTVSDSSDMYYNYLSVLSVSRSGNFSILYVFSARGVRAAHARAQSGLTR